MIEFRLLITKYAFQVIHRHNELCSSIMTTEKWIRIENGMVFTALTALYSSRNNWNSKETYQYFLFYFLYYPPKISFKTVMVYMKLVYNFIELKLH
jgi:hypothetical protein